MQVARTLKLPLLFIDKSNNLRCFRNLNKEALSVIYRSQTNAWPSCDVFKDWFFSCFVSQTKQKLRELGQEERAILFLDNCFAHPSEEVHIFRVCARQAKSFFFEKS